MAIDFPNQSRSYDAKRHCVRFWGHDDAREVSFLVDEDALTQIDRTTPRTEAEFLVAFDGNRERIFKAARKAYSPRGSGFFALAASDF
jgi:hypothetical protein